jgi:hypothetical protein
MAERYSAISPRPVAIAKRTEEGFVHQSGAGQSGDEESSAKVKCCCASLTVGLKLIVEQGVCNRFSKVWYLICIPKGWLNSGRLPIDDGCDSGRIVIGNKNVPFMQIGVK